MTDPLFAGGAPLLYLVTVMMGLVEGLTEFLPISSTGHLILTGELLGFEQLLGDEAGKAFTIIIQAGAILAVVAAYPARFRNLFAFDGRRGLCGLRGLGLLLVTSIPAAVLALVAQKFIHARLFNPATVAAALAVGAIGILLVERFTPRVRTEGVDALSWREALGIGLFQCAALWPGMSRSAATIVGGMICGVQRKTATEYSFFAAVPIMLAATGYEVLTHLHLFDASQTGVFALGFVVSFLCAWAAVKFFVHFLARHTLVPFGWYRLAVAGLVAWCLVR